MPRGLTVLLCLAMLPALSISASAQCILRNPSFELPGSGGQAFSGWNQFGSVGAVGVADHGFQAARVSGPDWGDPGVSGVWQSQDCVEGEVWRAAGRVRHSSARPLTGSNHAMVNIEWRNAAEELLGYDTFAVAAAGDPTDEYLDFAVSSNPAPPGVATTRILYATLQVAGTPSADVYYDTVIFESQSPPTLDDVQWNDFPGNRTIAFAGRQWRVKGPGYYGPGPNLFCDNVACVWVDTEGSLHLTNQLLGSSWYSTEVVLEDALGYGDYILTTSGRLDLIDPQTVLGIFLWQYGPCWDYSYTSWNAFNEVDIEYSRWGNPASDIAQFVAQPWDFPGNRERFDLAFAEGELVSHAMRWLPDRVEYRVWRGEAGDESEASMVHAWTYTGPHIPRPEQPRLHLNLWKLEFDPLLDQEVVFTDFTFVPAGGATGVAESPGPDRRGLAPAHLHPARPNPFNPSTSIRFELDRGERVRLSIYDLAGRKVRALIEEPRSAGVHEVVWDGRNDAGHMVASGVYLVHLEGRSFAESRRVALVK
jgi:hypothetical protein